MLKVRTLYTHVGSRAPVDGPDVSGTVAVWVGGVACFRISDRLCLMDFPFVHSDINTLTRVTQQYDYMLSKCEIIPFTSHDSYYTIVLKHII